MVVQTRTWENVLLALASEAYQSVTAVPIRHIQNQTLLREAYTYCEKLTAEHSRSFYLASSWLPAEQRRAVRALYTYCRVTDDIVDCPTGDISEALAVWRSHAFSAEPPRTDLAAVAWADTRSKYDIPLRYAEQLFDGVARDTHQTRYETFADLTTYCYGVASTVGLMGMHIIGFETPEAVPYAIKLGLALQLTNILRDIGEDWRRGRFYLPQEELAAFGLTESDIARGVVTDQWRAFMRFQIARNHALYEEAWPGIGMLHRNGRFAIATAGGVYRAILQDIEANDYDVFNRRAYVSTWGKARLLPHLWWSIQ